MEPLAVSRERMLESFWEERLEFRPDAKSRWKDLSDAYRKFANDKGSGRLSAGAIEDLYRKVDRNFSGIGKKKDRVWEGVALK
jgi:hypothetical protein